MLSRHHVDHDDQVGGYQVGCSCFLRTGGDDGGRGAGGSVADALNDMMGGSGADKSAVKVDIDCAGRSSLRNDAHFYG